MKAKYVWAIFICLVVVMTGLVIMPELFKTKDKPEPEHLQGMNKTGLTLLGRNDTCNEVVTLHDKDAGVTCYLYMGCSERSISCLKTE